MGGKNGMLNQTGLLSGLEGIRSGPLPGRRPGGLPRGGQPRLHCADEARPPAGWGGEL